MPLRYVLSLCSPGISVHVKPLLPSSKLLCGQKTQKGLVQEAQDKVGEVHHSFEIHIFVLTFVCLFVQMDGWFVCLKTLFPGDV